MTESTNPADHIGLALTIARKAWRTKPSRYMTEEDVEQVALLALVRYARSFDATRGTRFSTYVGKCIEGSVRTALTRQRRIVTNRHPYETTPLRNVRWSDVSADSDEMRRVGYAQGGDVSGDTIASGTKRSLFDDMTDDRALDCLAARDAHEHGAAVLARLEPLLCARGYAILRDRVMADEPVTLEEIAQRFGVSRERIRQIEASVIAKARKVAQDMEDGR